MQPFQVAIWRLALACGFETDNALWAHNKKAVCSQPLSMTNKFISIYYRVKSGRQARPSSKEFAIWKLTQENHRRRGKRTEAGKTEKVRDSVWFSFTSEVLLFGSNDDMTSHLSWWCAQSCGEAAPGDHALPCTFLFLCYPASWSIRYLPLLIKC